MRLNFIMTLIKDCQDSLDTNSVFKANNALVTYRCSPLEDTDFLRIYTEMAKFSNQIFYLCKNDQAQVINWKLLYNCKDLKSLQSRLTEEEFWRQIRFIEMFKVEENPFFFEEEFQYKVGVKRDHQDMIKSEGGVETNNKYNAKSSDS